MRIIRCETGLWSVEDQQTILDHVRKILINGTLVQGNQEVYFIADGMDRFIFDPYLIKVMPTSDSGFDILIYEDVIAMTGENLSHDEADGLHALARLASDTDTHIHSHRGSLSVVFSLFLRNVSHSAGVFNTYSSGVS
jgi:hypothetical protein